jgi:hypothetical protein
MKRREVLGLAGAAGVAGFVGLQIGPRSVSAPAVQRLSRTLVGETVNIKDYCQADGRRIDTQQYQELIDLQPSTIVYPPDTRLMLDATVQLRGNQVHNFAAGARIDAHANGYALAGTGRTGQHLSNLSAPVRRYARQIVLERTPSLAAGDVIMLADVSDAATLKLEINEVESLAGNVLATRYPVGRPFPSVSGFRLYRLDNPMRNLAFTGAAILTNHHPKGGGIRVNSGVDLQLNGLTIQDVGYIGISIEATLRAQLSTIAVHGSGASGLGLRDAKDVIIDGFAARNVRADESLTFYENVSRVQARNITIEQYLYQDRPPGYSAGNDILVDWLCSRIALSQVSCSGSATYNVMFNNQCDDCSLTDFDLSRSNLGGIRVSAGCNNTRIARGTISDVTDAFDSEGHKPVSAISVGSTCNGTTIGADVRYERIATGQHVGTLLEG